MCSTAATGAKPSFPLRRQVGAKEEEIRAMALRLERHAGCPEGNRVGGSMLPRLP